MATSTPPRTEKPSSVGAVIARLRKMLGHARKKDRVTVLEAIEAIEELATRLHEAKAKYHALKMQVAKQYEPPTVTFVDPQAREDLMKDTYDARGEERP